MEVDRVKRFEKYVKWAGPLHDLVEAVRVLIAEIDSASKSEPPCEIEIALPNKRRTVSSPDLLEHRLDERDLSAISSIRIEIGEEVGTYVSIQVSKTAPAISLEVTGDDENMVEGLFSRLGDILRRGEQRIQLLVGWLGIPLLVVLMVVMLQVLLDSFGTLPDRTGDRDLPPWALLPLIGIPLALIFGGIWLFPPLQVLSPGQAPRSRRFRVWAAGAISAVVLGILSAWLYGLTDSG